MAVGQLWGLAAAGKITTSFVIRLPILQRHLGPIFSTSYRLASRFANTLRAGKPVRNVTEMQLADVILLCLPGGPLTELADPAFLDGIVWLRKIVLICDSSGADEIIRSLRHRGAQVGTLSVVPGLPELFVVTGDRAALRIAKIAVKSLRGHTVEIAHERLPLFEAAVTLTSSLFTPLLEVTVECLRKSGLEQPVAANTADALFLHSLRGFKRAGRKSWSGPVALALAGQPALRQQQAALRAVNPMMASYFDQSTRFSFELYRTYPELTRYNKARWETFRKNYFA